MQRRIAGRIVAVHVRTVEQQVLQVLHETVSARLRNSGKWGGCENCSGIGHPQVDGWDGWERERGEKTEGEQDHNQSRVVAGWQNVIICLYD